MLTLLALLLFATVAEADTVTATLPEYNGPRAVSGTVYPLPPTTVGIFDLTSLTGRVTTATISGTFGNSYTNSSAGVDLYLDGILVAQCLKGATCWWGTNGPTAWSFTLSGDLINIFADRHAVLTAVQTSGWAVRLGQMQLTLETIPNPEPGSLALFGTGLVTLAGLVRRQMKKRAAA